MKRLRVSKKQGIIAALVFVVFISVIGVVRMVNAWQQRVDRLSIENTAQGNEIHKLKLELQSLKIGNGTSLDQCLDKAAKTYAAANKSSGELNVVNGQEIYTHEMSVWQKNHDRLQADREECNKKFD